MTEPESTFPIEPRLRILQIIIAALIAGVAIFAIIVLAMKQPPSSTFDPVLRVALVIITAVMTISAVAIPAIIRRAASRSDGADISEDQLFGRFFVLTIMRAAMLEGAALFGIVIFLLSADPIDLAIAAVPLILMILLAYPSRGRWESLLDNVRYRRI